MYRGRRHHLISIQTQQATSNSSINNSPQIRDSCACSVCGGWIDNTLFGVVLNRLISPLHSDWSQTHRWTRLRCCCWCNNRPKLPKASLAMYTFVFISRVIERPTMICWFLSLGLFLIEHTKRRATLAHDKTDDNWTIDCTLCYDHHRVAIATYTACASISKWDYLIGSWCPTVIEFLWSGSIWARSTFVWKREQEDEQGHIVRWLRDLGESWSHSPVR